MTVASVPAVDVRTRLQDWIPKLVLSPSLAVILVFVYGFIVYSLYLSFSSELVPLRLSNWPTAMPVRERNDRLCGPQPA